MENHDVAGDDDSPVSQPGSMEDAQGNRMDVGRGRALPAPHPDPALELPWRVRGPQTAKDIAETGKPSQWSSEVLKGILKHLNRTMSGYDVAGDDDSPVSQPGSMEDAQGNRMDVGRGRALPAPHPDPALELPWRVRGPQTAKDIAETGKPSQWSSEVLKGILKHLNRTMSGYDVAGDDDSPVSQPGSMEDAQGNRMDVGRGRALPAPHPDPALELPWRVRGPQTAKDIAETGKPSQWSSEVLKGILKHLNRTMSGYDVAGDDDSPVSQPGSMEDAQGNRMDVGRGRALPAPHPDPALELPWRVRGPQTAKDIAETGKPSQWSSEVLKGILKHLNRTMSGYDVAGDDDSPVSQPGSMEDAQGNRMDVGRGRALPAPHPDPALELPWRHRGPQTAKDIAETGKPSHPSSEFLQEILMAMDWAMSGYGMDNETVEKEAFWEGGSQMMPASDETTGAIQSTGMPVLSNPGEADHARIDRVLQYESGRDGKRRSDTVTPKNYWRYIIEGFLAFLGYILVSTICWCVICVCRRSKWRLDKTLGSQPPAPEQPDHPP
ncbi:uncharacterized protein LOC141971172 [Athene noctua]|uniref:uncharacterized protein LOC141971172 n=1 Tax=Athene noctua TaxID=126797 RepID=UPI003EC0719A